MNDRLIITGLGAVSPLGLSARDQTIVANGWIFDDIDAAARVKVQEYRHTVLSIPETFSIKDYVTPVALRRKQRFSQIAMAAAVDAFADSGLADRPANLERVGLVASTEYGPQRAVGKYLDGLIGGGLFEASPGLFTQTVYNVANGQASLALGLKGANSTIVGGSSVAYAALLIATRKADAIFALSVDETNEIMTSYFDAADFGPGDLAFTFRTGEAAAVVVLESQSSALARGATELAELLGWSSASAPGLGVSYADWAEDDTTIAHAMLGALRDADLAISNIDLVVGTANGLGVLSRSEFSAIRGLGYTGPVLYPRLMTGECFGGNEALAYILGLNHAAPGSTMLITVSTANGGVTSTVVRKAAS
ncbi:beta-ketoacyl synthase N-terminal-like domain-containing protein [Cryobacterium sp. TMS1-13-1]|uniref:beta-ketoacyl synthase N-terminal-like domain-containing protein n=1 Tax=Cryobacterium sp. TMS1-13-1 TaxID=1259220 RepID=UPI00141AB61C|nr:beta-ketoacyl synthase N-terminal-like domain-containing protein [Cryobacterium sp. TMS1-13-1]